MSSVEMLSRLTAGAISLDGCSPATGEKLEHSDIAAALSGLPGYLYDIAAAYYCLDNYGKFRVINELNRRFGDEVSEDAIMIAWNIFITPPPNLDSHMERTPIRSRREIRRMLQILYGYADQIASHLSKNLGY